MLFRLVALVGEAQPTATISFSCIWMDTQLSVYQVRAWVLMGFSLQINQRYGDFRFFFLGGGEGVATHYTVPDVLKNLDGR